METSHGNKPRRPRRGGKGENAPLSPEQKRERVRAQVKIIRSEMGRDNVGVALPPDSDDVADYLYLYRRGAILVRDEDVVRVTAALDQQARVLDSLVGGVTLLEVLTGEEVPLVLERLDAALGAGVATPDHVLYVCAVGGGRCCPATEPDEPPSHKPVPAVSKEKDAGRGVLVSVVDTGWWPDAATSRVSPWLKGVTGDAETIDPTAIHPYAGHGTFIAGVVRCVAPATEVRVEGFLTHGGAAFEGNMVVQLVETMALGPDIINLSAGTVTRGHAASLAFQVFYEKYLSQVKNTVLVAAAGNDSTRAPFWPAAFPWAVSVGATDASGARSDYSNHGSWVDVSAQGSGLVNAFPVGTYTCSEPPHAGDVRHFKGMAQWSGTSFSTPVVVGLIAARMGETGLSARHAAEQVLAESRAHAVPGVGPFLSLP
ncbi:S8 family peptidase [Nocardioides sp.]|uniref:S8 family peptidase n=1 Tax=Nocardioides sp. TaxID=35761 RepID=UPI002B26FD0E|nr:S8 family serine peptidase [Nocardioides sp.]